MRKDSSLHCIAGACTAHVTEQRLNAGDEHLVIATQGFWDVVSADDAALLLHFHLKVWALPTTVSLCSTALLDTHAQT